MSPAFGFSVGDFAGAIQLIVKVSKALKDSRGASHEYQSVVQELESLRAVFEHLASAGLSLSRDGPHGVSIKAHANSILKTLSGFLEVISKFDRKLGMGAAERWHHGSARKAQWAVLYTKEVEKLRLAIGTQLQSLNLLLGLDERYVFYMDKSPLKMAY